MKVQVINNSTNKLPEYSTLGAAGLDVCANLVNLKGAQIKGIRTLFDSNEDTVTILPGGRALIPTGLYFAIPEGYHLDVRPRSGLALKQGLTIINSPGLLDSDYRGELGVVLINHSDKNQVIAHGDRIAQVVLMKFEKIDWDLVDSLPETARGSGGFGSTGK